MLTARNIVCHGFATLIELLFMSFGEVDDTNDPWFDEYLSGAGLEVYYIPLHFEFISELFFDWSLLVEGLYLEYGVMMIGVCNIQEQIISLNPSVIEMENFSSPADFFAKYNVGIIIADESATASAINQGTLDTTIMQRIKSKIINNEKQLCCRISNLSKKKSRKIRAPTVKQPTSRKSNVKTIGEFQANLGFVDVSEEIIQSLKMCTWADICQVC